MTVVVPESTSPQPVINVTVHVHQAGGKLKTIVFLILIGFICWDGYFNKFAYIQSAFSVTKQVVQPYIPISSELKGVDYRLVKIIHRAQELAPFPIDVLECIRDQSRQNKLFAQGFSWTTNSYHKTGHACDLKKQGVAQTDDKASWGSLREINTYMQQAAREQGVKLIWGGDWKTTPDGFHWQVPRDSFVKPPIQKTTKKFVAKCAIPDPRNKKDVSIYVECEGAKAGLPVGYMGTLACVESRYNYRAVSSAGAQGLFQFMPATAKEVGLKNPFDVVQATIAAVKYNKSLRVGHDAATLYMKYNMGACGYKVINEVATRGFTATTCGDRTIIETRSVVYNNIKRNVSGKYKGKINRQRELNRVAAQTYIKFMTEYYWPKGQRSWQKIKGN